MSYSSLSDNWMLQMFSFLINSLKLFPHIHGYLFIFAQILKFTSYSVKLIEKLSRRHLINSSDVFVNKGFTVLYNSRVCCRLIKLAKEFNFYVNLNIFLSENPWSENIQVIFLQKKLCKVTFMNYSLLEKNVKWSF